MTDSIKAAIEELRPHMIDSDEGRGALARALSVAHYIDGEMARVDEAKRAIASELGRIERFNLEDVAGRNGLAVLTTHARRIASRVVAARQPSADMHAAPASEPLSVTLTTAIDPPSVSIFEAMVFAGAAKTIEVARKLVEQDRVTDEKGEPFLETFTIKGRGRFMCRGSLFEVDTSEIAKVRR